MLLDVEKESIDGGVIANWDTEFVKSRIIILVRISSILVRISSGPMKSRACNYWVQRVPHI
jgi:hypothetical protein